MLFMRIRTSVLICFFSICFSGLVAQNGNNYVTLKGKLINFTNQEEIQDLSDLQYLLPATAERMIIADDEGNFEISFVLDAPNYFRIGRNILYLSPGDNMVVTIDKNKPGAATFNGRGDNANLYSRNTPFPKGGSFVEAGRRVQKVAKSTIDTILFITAERKKELKKVSGVSQEFRRLEEARVKADMINSLRAGMTSYKPRLSEDSLKFYADQYILLATPLIAKHAKNFTDTSLMKLVVYRDVLNEIIKHNQNSKELQNLKEWQKANALVREMKMHSDKKILSAYISQVDAITTTRYRNALKQTLDNLLKFGKGDIAKDFTGIDMEGNKVQLSDLKGKVIYVDLWATWCGPCLVEMPYYDSLKKKYKENTDIAFISLSIDDNINLWKKNVKARNADGIQWQINRNALNDYDIVSIPRSLLIDKEFKIVDMNAPMPSSKEIIPLIESLL